MNNVSEGRWPSSIAYTQETMQRMSTKVWLVIVHTQKKPIKLQQTLAGPDHEILST